MSESDIPQSAESIARGLNTSLLARSIIYRERIDSTNNLARALAETGAPEGTVVIADVQTAGRGRLGRTWLAPPRSSVLMSLILRPNLAPPELGLVTMAASLGARAAIQTETGLQARIKWPNDLLANGKKCGGLLTEANTVGDELEYVILGLGINVNFSASSVEGIPPEATTIADELGHPIPRVLLTRALLRAIEDYYRRLLARQDLSREWATHLSTLGQHVVVHSPWGVEEGLAEGVDEYGALLLRRSNGTIVRLVSGQVTLAPH